MLYRLDKWDEGCRNESFLEKQLSPRFLQSRLGLDNSIFHNMTWLIIWLVCVVINLRHRI